MRGQRHAPVALYPRERPGTHCTGAWVGPRAGLDGCGKPLPPPGFDPRTVQPVGSPYTEYVTQPTSPQGIPSNIYNNSEQICLKNLIHKSLEIYNC
jgi:hypothetical protein